MVFIYILNGEFKIMNGAAEAILEDILKQVTLSNVTLVAILRQAGTGGPGGGPSGGPSGGPTLGPVTAGLKIFGPALSAVTGVIGYLSNIVGATTKHIVDFGKAAIAGTASVSQMIKVFDQLPIVGKLFDLFGEMVAYQESLLVSYRTLTQSGASFSGSLYEMRDMAFKTYMTLAEFGKVVTENSQLFSTAMGGVDAGIKVFQIAQSKLMDPKGEFGKNLLGLGVTASEAADMLGTYMRMQGNMTKVNTQSTADMAKTTNGLIVELDTFSKLTGVNRAELEKTMKEAAFDENVKRFLSGLNPAQLAAAQAKLAEGLQLAGKGGSDYIAQMLMSQGRITAPLTQAAQDAFIQTRGSLVAFGRIAYESAMREEVGSKEAAASTVKMRNEVYLGGKSFTDQFGPNGSASVGILNMVGAISLVGAISKTVNRGMNDMAETAEDSMNSIVKRQQDQYNGQAAGLARAEMQIKLFGSTLGSVFLQLINKFQPAITVITDVLLNMFGGAVTSLSAPNGVFAKLSSMIIDYVVPVITDSIKWLSETFTALSNTDPDKFWTAAGDKLKEAFSKIGSIIGPPLALMWQEAKPIIISAFIDLFIGMLNAVKIILTDVIKSAFKMDADSVAAREKMVGSMNYTKDLTDLISKSTSLPASAIVEAKRATGSLGMTGNLFENFGKETPVMLHGTEAVVTPAQMDNIMNNNLLGEIQVLNKLTAELLKYTKDSVDYAQRTLSATQSLNGNKFV